MMPPQIRRRVTLISLVVALLAALVTVAPVAQAEPDVSMTVTGVVRNAAGKPLNTIVVKLRMKSSPSGPEVRTDSAGRFSITTSWPEPSRLYVIEATDTLQRYDPFTSKAFSIGAGHPPFSIRMKINTGSLRVVPRPTLDGVTLRQSSTPSSLHLIRVNDDGTRTTELRQSRYASEIHTFGNVQPGTYQAFMPGRFGAAPWLPSYASDHVSMISFYGVCAFSGEPAAEPSDCYDAPTWTVERRKQTDLGEIPMTKYRGFIAGTTSEASGEKITRPTLEFYSAPGRKLVSTAIG